ncbi:hypothetical protein HMPREF3180_01595 [Leptotrichia wadei]|uniref:Uncharacterized protein n=2 Tax=root TaxID=1 RepID=A0A134A6K8_9FUSO|nr:hypothetical protein HMPREF3180_01595 [Leptotrichia wadei]
MQKVVLIRKKKEDKMKIAILLILLVPILFWIVFIWTIFENAVERMKNYNLLGMLASLGFGILMAYGLYEFLLKIIDPG